MLLKNTDFSPSSFSKGHFNLSCLWVSITFATHECYLHNRRARLMLGQTFHKNSILSLLAAENGLQNWFASSSFKDFFISQYFGNHESQNHVKIYLLVFSIRKHVKIYPLVFSIRNHVKIYLPVFSIRKHVKIYPPVFSIRELFSAKQTVLTQS